MTPKTVKHELRAFYAQQGLTGKHLRKAMAYDLRRVRKYRSMPGRLMSAFSWMQTSEGGRYWAARSGVSWG